jgi:hypothetical protein
MGFSTRAFATSPFTAGIDQYENMEADVDTYTPTNTDPLNDPNLDGLPPGVGVGDAGLPNGSPGEDWGEIRNGGGSGVIEEVPNGFLGTNAPDGSAHFAIAQFEGADGPFGRVNRDRFTPIASFPGGSYSATADIYVDPSRPYGGNDGVPDFWMTNAINGDATSGIPNGYATESGITGTVDPSGTTWSIATTNGLPLGVVPVGSWIGYEMQVIPSVANPGQVAFLHKLYADGGSHSVLIGSTIVEDYTGPAVLATYAQITGPRYIWFTNAQANMPYVIVDNVGWVAVPEPASIGLLGLGAIGALARRRRA